MANYDNGVCRVGGCLNSLSPTYDSTATFNDGSCAAVPCSLACLQSNMTITGPPCEAMCAQHNGMLFRGCTNSNADNYRPIATIDDGSCEIGGCTDPTSARYDSAATFNDGSCFGRRRLGWDGRAGPQAAAEGVQEVERAQDDEDDEDEPRSDARARRLQVAAAIEGCMVTIATNYNASAQRHRAGSCVYAIPGCTQPLDPSYSADATDDSMCVVTGCMDPDALNYDATATRNSGCSYTMPGCKHPHAHNYGGPMVTVDDGSCVFGSSGCTVYYPTTNNYDPHARVDDGSCIFRISGCMSVNSLNYDSAANHDDGSCITATLGCMAPAAFNFNPAANKDDGSCSCSRRARRHLATPISPPPLPSVPPSPPPLRRRHHHRRRRRRRRRWPPPPCPPPSPPAPPIPPPTPPSPPAPPLPPPPRSPCVLWWNCVESPPPPLPNPPPPTQGFCEWEWTGETCDGLALDLAAPTAALCQSRCCEDALCHKWEFGVAAPGCYRGQAGNCTRLDAPGIYDMGFKVNSSAAPGTGVPGDGLTFRCPSPPPPPPPPPEGFPNAPPTPGTDAAGAQTAVGSRWEVAIIALAAGLALLACLIGCGCLQFYTKAAENRRVHPRTAEQASAKAKAEAKAKRDAEAFKAAAPKVHALPQLARAWEGIDGRSGVSFGAASA